MRQGAQALYPYADLSLDAGQPPARGVAAGEAAGFCLG